MKQVRIDDRIYEEFQAHCSKRNVSSATAASAALLMYMRKKPNGTQHSTFLKLPTLDGTTYLEFYALVDSQNRVVRIDNNQSRLAGMLKSLEAYAYVGYRIAKVRFLETGTCDTAEEPAAAAKRDRQEAVRVLRRIVQGVVNDSDVILSPGVRPCAAACLDDFEKVLKILDGDKPKPSAKEPEVKQTRAAYEAMVSPELLQFIVDAAVERIKKDGTK